jgi:hypothetical protein
MCSTLQAYSLLLLHTDLMQSGYGILVLCSARPLLATPGSRRYVHRVLGGSSSNSRPLPVFASATTRGVTGVEQGMAMERDLAQLYSILHVLCMRCFFLASSVEFAVCTCQ